MKRVFAMLCMSMLFSALAVQHNVTVTTFTGGTYSGLVDATTTGADDTVNVTLEDQCFGFVVEEADNIGRLTFIKEGTPFGGVTISSTGNIVVSGDIDLGTNNLTNDAGTINIGGSFLNVGSLSNSNNSTIEYSGSSAQTLFTGTYENLTLSGGGQKNISGNVIVNDVLDCNTSTVVMSSGSVTITTLSAEGSNITVSGGTLGGTTFTAGTSSVLNVSGGTVNPTTFDASSSTINLSSGTFAPATFNGSSSSLVVTGGTLNPTTFNAGTGTVTYSASTGQNITDLGSAYNHLVIGGSGTKQFASSAIDIDGDLTISSATLSLGLADVTLAGSFSNSGTFSNNNKKVTFDGSAAVTISGTVQFLDLDISKTDGAGTVTINNAVSIEEGGTISLTNGTSNLVVGSGSLSLNCTSASNAARVAEIPSGSSITGNVTVNRYVPSTSRSWWHLTNAVKNVTVADWQDDMIITGGFTGAGTIAGKTSTGSIYNYIENINNTVLDTGWRYFPVSSNGESFSDGQGYRVFIRQDSTESVSPVTIDATGELFQGEVDFGVTYVSSGNADADGWNFLGNPYASPISWSTGTWTKTNVAADVYVWNATSKSYAVNPTNIASQQGFWIQTNASSPSLKLQEDCKTTSGTFTRPSSVANSIEIALSDEDPSQLFDLATATLIFDDLSLSTYEDGSDVGFLSRNWQLVNEPTLVDIASKSSDGRRLFTNSFPTSSDIQEIDLYTVFSDNNDFKLVLTPSNFEEGVSVVLRDNYTGSEVIISGRTEYAFTTDANSSSTASDRFTVLVQRPLSTNSVDGAFGLSVYPNPANEFFNVDVRGLGEGATLSVTNLNGEVVYTSIIEGASSERIEIGTESLESGIYVVKVENGQNTLTEKLIIE